MTGTVQVILVSSRLRPSKPLARVFPQNCRAFGMKKCAISVSVSFWSFDRARAAPAVIGLRHLLLADDQEIVAALADGGRAMHPRHVGVVVVELVPEGDRQHLRRIGDDDAWLVEIGIAAEGGRGALAEEGEDEPAIFARGIGADFDAMRKWPLLGRLLDALAGRVELPAVIAAADGVALDPAEREGAGAMGAAVFDHVRLAGLRRGRR